MCVTPMFQHFVLVLYHPFKHPHVMPFWPIRMDKLYEYCFNTFLLKVGLSVTNCTCDKVGNLILVRVILLCLVLFPEFQKMYSTVVEYKARQIFKRTQSIQQVDTHMVLLSYFSCLHNHRLPRNLKLLPTIAKEAQLLTQPQMNQLLNID